ncbi:hypothetical protein [Pseudomonas sp. ANT_H12B]|uniref:hypothetical protein n=1 Tax=Pseudomonas sp. ANT_H12B TaxID=2597348 RepID=UPI0011EF3652|nr:hypothetical protein [Pseudomonas sp. ANT_H12B]KAA0959616.1 hypothetical protein FQ185_26080 [Pseudomonas sp. ANT_H12B]
MQRDLCIVLRPRVSHQPYRPSAIDVSLSRISREDKPCVNVAIAATTMKLNPRFLLACQKIAELTLRV